MTDYDPEEAAKALIREGWPKRLAYAMADRALAVKRVEPMRFLCALCGAGLPGILSADQTAPWHKPAPGKHLRLHYGHCPGVHGPVVVNPHRTG